MLSGEGLGGGIVSGYGGANSSYGINPLTVTNSRIILANFARAAATTPGPPPSRNWSGSGPAGVTNYIGGSGHDHRQFPGPEPAIAGTHGTAGGSGTPYADFGAGRGPLQ